MFPVKSTPYKNNGETLVTFLHRHGWLEAFTIINRWLLEIKNLWHIKPILPPSDPLVLLLVSTCYGKQGGNPWALRRRVPSARITETRDRQPVKKMIAKLVIDKLHRRITETLLGLHVFLTFSIKLVVRECTLCIIRILPSTSCEFGGLVHTPNRISESLDSFVRDILNDESLNYNIVVVLV